MLKTVLTLVCAWLMGASACFAVPADPRPFVVTQPDGSTLTVRMIGDEFFHSMMTEDGYLVKRSSDGVYYFVDNEGKAMDVMACDASKRTDAVKQTLVALNPEKTFNELKASALATSKMWNSQKMMRAPI